MKISSPAFSDDGMIPPKYTCQGSDINPQLDISEIPPNTKTLALIVDDPDAPSGDWVHWVLFNVAVTNRILENSAPGILGRNDFGRNTWGGPCPPSGTHRYLFKIYSLDTALELRAGATKKDLEKAMAGHILGKAVLTGLYKRIIF